MQRDQKVGLALGVLLIGVVAAFFFRNEPEPGREMPTLENAAEVDREISEKRLTPYFSGIETDEPARGLSARTAASSVDQQDRRTGERKLPRWQDALKSAEDDPFAEHSGRTDVPAPAPDPIHYEAAKPPTVPQPPTEHNQVWQVEQEPAATPGTVTASETGTPLIHEVQRGETLSSIAGKHLGSQARFHEIFAANREQLEDANSLKVGMKLRIPHINPKTVTGKSEAEPSRRAKRSPNGKPVFASPLEMEETPVVKERDAVANEASEREAVPPDEDFPAAEAPVDVPKRKFTPAKRRPARSGI